MTLPTEVSPLLTNQRFLSEPVAIDTGLLTVAPVYMFVTTPPVVIRPIALLPDDPGIFVNHNAPSGYSRLDEFAQTTFITFRSDVWSKRRKGSAF